MNDFDYVIVGAGSAGSVIAARLTEDPGVSVLLLESGGPLTDDDHITVPTMWPTLYHTDFDYDYETTPQAGTGRTHGIPRGHVVGGTGSTNAMAYLRGAPSDFDSWSCGGATGWDYASVLPYFKRMESVPGGDPKYRGLNGPLSPRPVQELSPLSQAYIAGAQQAGYQKTDDHNGACLYGVGAHDMLIVQGRRQSTATAYLEPALIRSNLSLWTNVRVQRLVLDGNRCDGVEIVKDGVRSVIRASREVIMCAGAVDSPKLLLLSGIGPKEHLEEVGVDCLIDLPGVGRNLQDHILLGGLLIEAPEPLEAPSGNLGDVTLLLDSDDETRLAPDLQIVLIQVPLANPWQETPENSFAFGVGHMRPSSRGYLELVDADPATRPRLELNYLQTDHDLQALVRGVRKALAISETAAFDPFRSKSNKLLEASDEEIADFVREAVLTYGHQSGTCKMGVDTQAVVDPHLRVHGIYGLRVADASVMPTIVSTNTHAATIMIAEKAADLIREIEQSPETRVANA